jgi:hypothetical protein
MDPERKDVSNVYGRRGGRRGGWFRGGLWVILSATLLAPVVSLDAASLRPSRPSLLRQVYAAHDHHYPYARSSGEVQDLVRRGYLVRLAGNGDYELKESMSFPYARREVRLFIERLSGQYRDRCGEKLVVTSLVRPKSRQPRNASPLSVHPTGMAMDLRVSWKRACRAWLEGTLIQLEKAGVLEAARERHPPHYHVALFPGPYLDYVEQLTGRQILADSGVDAYRVQRGDNLWRIAHRHGTTVEQIREVNGLHGNLIKAGQVLAIPRN